MRSRLANLDEIMLAVRLASGVTESDILGGEVTPEISAARAVFVGLARMHTLCSFPEIAARMNRGRYNGNIHTMGRLFARALESDSDRSADRAIRRIIAELDPSWLRSGLDQRPGNPFTPQRMEARHEHPAKIA